MRNPLSPTEVVRSKALFTLLAVDEDASRARMGYKALFAAMRPQQGKSKKDSIPSFLHKGMRAMEGHEIAESRDRAVPGIVDAVRDAKPLMARRGLSYSRE